MSNSQPADQPLAFDGIRELLDMLELGAVASVPGNHDITWDETFGPQQRLLFYNDLVQQLVPATPNTRDYPHVIVAQPNDERPVACILLNSCGIESRAQAGLGYVGREQLEQAERRLRELDVSAETHTIIAALHHHLLPVAPAIELPASEDPNAAPRLVVSVTIDANTVIRELARLGVSLVLHGHQHVYGIITLQDSRWSARPPLYIAACGSCGVEEAGVRRHFWLWSIENDVATATALQEDPNDRDSFALVSATPLRLRYTD